MAKTFYSLAELNDRIQSGTYTPTAPTSHINGASVTFNGNTRYTKIGDIVTVSGYLFVTSVTSVSTYTGVSMSIPIASNFADTNGRNEITGSCHYRSNGGAWVIGDVTGNYVYDSVNIDFYSDSSATTYDHYVSFEFTYKII